MEAVYLLSYLREREREKERERKKNIDSKRIRE